MPWPDGVPSAIRDRACAALGHRDVGAGPHCPCTDDQLMADLVEEVRGLREHLAHLEGLPYLELEPQQ